MSKSRVLFLTHCDLRTDAVGGQVRALNMVRALQEMAEVRVVYVDHDATPLTPNGSHSDAETRVHDVAVVRESPPPSLDARMRMWLDPKCIDLHGAEVDSADRKRILAMLPDFDMVWIHHLLVANLFGQWHWPHSLIDIDDIPSTYKRSVWRHGSRMSERLKAGAHMLAARRREKLLTDRFTVMSVCSNDDREYLGNLDNIHVIPNGFDRPAQPAARQPAMPPRVGFIGPFNFQANVEGIEWFTRECWPAIKKAVPTARLRLVGRGSDGIKKPKGPDIDGLGWLDDPAAEIATWSVMIVPIHLGAGTRVKIAEAFSRKCPVVSTNLGAYGYGLADRKQLRLADKADDFSSACISLIRDPASGIAMAARAWELFLKQMTWDSIAPRVREAAEDCLRRSRQLAAH